jgi:ferrous iron transport protein A
MTLRDCAPGSHLVLRGLSGESPKRRLAEWGLVPGTRMRLVARGPAGGLIVAVGDARMALDSRTAASLIVEAAG